MKEKRHELSTTSLTLEQLKTLPKSVYQKAVQSAATQPESMHWSILAASDKSDLRLFRRVMQALSSMADGMRQDRTEENIAQLMRLYVGQEDRAQVDIDLERDNAALRSAYIKSVAAYSASEIRSFQPGKPPKNPSDPAARWKREGRVFAIPFGNIDLFPAFQFVEGAPRTVIKKILASLPSDMSAWQTAFWFSSVNGWLDGQEPAQSLENGDAVIHAAARLKEPAVG